MSATAAVDYNAMDDDAFRAEARAFFESEYPENLRFLPRRLTWAESKPWWMALSKKGWLAPNWPVEHGGTGWTPMQHYIFAAEMAAASAISAVAVSNSPASRCTPAPKASQAGVNDLSLNGMSARQRAMSAPRMNVGKARKAPKWKVSPRVMPSGWSPAAAMAMAIRCGSGAKAGWARRRWKPWRGPMLSAPWNSIAARRCGRSKV